MDRRGGLPKGLQRFDVAGGLVQDRDVRVSEAVDRLLAVADDEDRRCGGEAEPFPPGLDEKRDELPLRAARVLELVDQHMVIPGLESIAALRELVHLTQEIERALKDIREVEHRARIERTPVLRERDGEHASDAASHDRVEVARKARDHALDLRADLRHGGTVSA